MLPSADVKSFLRDLVYLEEEAYSLARRSKLPGAVKSRLMDSIYKKQVVVTKIINLLTQEL